MAKINPRIARHRRHVRVRIKVKGNGQRPRLNVFRSLNHIYAQVIDDTQGHTLASASSLDQEIKSSKNGKTKTARSENVGTLVAQRLLSQGIDQVVFDRGGYKYFGRIKALAEAARQAGLKM